jgi:hypothetical protein
MVAARMTSVREERPGHAEVFNGAFRRVGALCLLIAAAAAGWFAADRVLTEASATPTPPTAAVQRPAPPPALPPDLLISTDHGPMPILRPGETVVVQVKAATDKFIYCYYVDGSRQVARIFPNRFQPDAFVPAGQKVQIPPGPESERPFNIRLDTPRRLEAVTCLASPAEVDRSRIDGTDVEDLMPIPGLGLQDLFDAFDRLSATGASSQTLSISVVADADSRMDQH